MEVRLKQETFTYLDTVEESPFSFETTQEAIVPDYCADVQRIVDTTGCVLLHSKEMTADGRMELKGIIKASVLFIPEGEKDVSVLPLSLPMHSYCDGKHLANCEGLTVSARLKSIDSRLINPRKLLTRAETTIEICGYERKTLLLASEVEDEAILEKMQEEGETTIIASLVDREFDYVDELTVSATRPEIQEILSVYTELKPADCRILGNKLVMKGIACIELLYKDVTGNLSTLHQEFMFSQIAETDYREEGSTVHCSYRLIGYEYEIGSETNRNDRHVVTMKLHIQSHVRIMERKKVLFLSDLYSISHEVKIERQSLFLEEETQTAVKKQSLRELITTAVGVKDVVHTTVDCGICSCHSGEQGSFVEVPVRIRCLYIDDNDAILLGEKEIVIKAETELNSKVCPSISVQSAGEVSVAPAPDGIDVRFVLEFLIETKRIHEKTTILKVEMEENEGFAENMPSLVLRKFEKGTKLWDVAKLYHTTTADIVAANGLESACTVPADQLLLIPRHK